MLGNSGKLTCGPVRGKNAGFPSGACHPISLSSWEVCLCARLLKQTSEINENSIISSWIHARCSRAQNLEKLTSPEVSLSFIKHLSCRLKNLMGLERAIVRSGNREQSLAWIANNSWTHFPAQFRTLRRRNSLCSLLVTKVSLTAQGREEGNLLLLSASPRPWLTTDVQGSSVRWFWELCSQKPGPG